MSQQNATQDKGIVFQPGQEYRFKKSVVNPITLTDGLGLGIKMVQTKPEDGHVFSLTGEEAQRYVGDLTHLTRQKYIIPLP